MKELILKHMPETSPEASAPAGSGGKSIIEEATNAAADIIMKPVGTGIEALTQTGVDLAPGDSKAGGGGHSGSPKTK
jgi:hypothetical protein